MLHSLLLLHVGDVRADAFSQKNHAYSSILLYVAIYMSKAFAVAEVSFKHVAYLTTPVLSVSCVVHPLSYVSPSGSGVHWLHA